jgi:Undecaprenyl-phosphate glucose phosphotransferase
VTDLRLALFSRLGRLSKTVGRVRPKSEAPAAAQSRGFTLGHDGLALALDVLRFTDVVIVVLTGILAAKISGLFQHDGFHSPLNIELLVGVIAAPFIFDGLKAYARPSSHNGIYLRSTCISGFAALSALLLVIKVMDPFSGAMPFSALFIWLPLLLAMMFGARISFIGLVRGGYQSGLLRDTVAVVGSTPFAELLAARLRSCSNHTIDLLGVFDDDASGRGGAISPDGSLDDLFKLGQTKEIRHIILAVPLSEPERIESLLQQLKSLSADVSVCPETLTLDCLDETPWDPAALPLISFAERPLRQWSAVAKTVEDLVLGMLVLIVVAPLMLTVAVLIKLDSRGPVLFRQARHGLNNREITVFKFRTMHFDARDQKGERQTQTDDPRITRVGRFLRMTSVDELPQLFNVLNGDMSIVGPRAHPVWMRTENLLGEEILTTYRHRHRMKPGITGWAQVHGLRGPTKTLNDLRRRIELDLDYIDNWSLALDLKILLLTPLRLLIDEAQ